MKKFLLGDAGLVALAAPASAADLAARPYTKAPPMIAALYDWSGFYVGANGGWGLRHQGSGHNTPGARAGSARWHGAARGAARSRVRYRLPGCTLAVCL